MLCANERRELEIESEQNEATVRSDLEEQALLDELKRFVEDTKLSIYRIAELMGVYGATLSIWIAGTAKPHRAKLLEIKGFLESHAPEYLESCSKSSCRAHDQGVDAAF